MLYGIPQAASKFAVGLAGVAALSAGANVVAIVTEVVRRGISQIAQLASSANDETKIKQVERPKYNIWNTKDFTPYSDTASWKALGIAGLKNLVVGTAALYVANRFCPSLVTNANWLLHKAIAVQFTPDHIPLTKLAGL